MMQHFSPWPKLSDEEISAVAKVLRSNQVNYWTGGEGRRFERAFARITNCRYGIALANGTLALEVALRALDIGIGDEVIVTPRSFIASVSCVISVGAKPIFADIDLNSGNITAQNIKVVLTTKTKAIICVHLAGFPCEMDDIIALTKKHHIKVIEDCAQAHGAKYKNRSVGSIGDIAAWSFCQDKIMTTGGEGGMVTTNNEDLYQKVCSYKDHGKSYNALTQNIKSMQFPYVHESFGSNYRMLEISATIGNIQVKKLNAWQQIRKHNAEKIWMSAQSYFALSIPKIPHYMVHAYYRAYIFVDNSKLNKGWNTALIIKKINDLGVPCYMGVCPEIYLEKAFATKDFKPKHRLKNAKALSRNSLTFMVHPTLTKAEIKKTCATIRTVMNEADKDITNNTFA